MKYIGFVASIVCLLLITVTAELYNCGIKLDCYLDDAGSFLVRGTGPMIDYDPYWLPWKDYKYKIKHVVIEEGVTFVPKYSFDKCSELIDVVIPSTIENISDYLFDQCPKLVSVNMTEGLKRIGYEAFSYCPSLTDMTIPDTVEEIDWYSFYGCSSLKNVTIPSSAVVGHKAFCDCGNLSFIEVKEGNPHYKSVDGVLFDNSLKTLIQYPVGKPNPIYIVPDGVTKIEEGSMSSGNCLTYVIIPETVTEVGFHALHNSMKLTTVFYQGSTDPSISAANNIFDFDNGLLHICVPPDYGSDSFGDKTVDNNAQDCKTFQSLFNGCYKGSFNGQFIQQVRCNATEWEDRHDNCRIYKCPDSNGPVAWSTCNSTKDNRQFCLSDQCVKFNPEEKDKYFVDVEFEDEKKLIAVNMSEIFRIIQSEFLVKIDGMKAGIETNENNHVSHIIIYVNDEETATSLANRINILDKEYCHCGIFREAKAAHASVNGKYLSGSSCIHKMINYVIMLITMMIMLFHF